jgi:hypothetical protein
VHVGAVEPSLSKVYPTLSLNGEVRVAVDHADRRELS